jgi:hypothetical protein
VPVHIVIVAGANLHPVNAIGAGRSPGPLPRGCTCPRLPGVQEHPAPESGEGGAEGLYLRTRLRPPLVAG